MVARRLTQHERAALAVLSAALRRHGTGPLRFTDTELPPPARRAAIHAGWIVLIGEGLDAGTRSAVLNITREGAKALAPYLERTA